MAKDTISFGRFFIHVLKKLPDIACAIRSAYMLLTIKPEQHLSMGLLLENQAKKYPDNKAILYGNDSISYRQLNERCNQTAHYLQQSGIRRHDVVAIMLDNRPFSLIAVFAVAKLGATAAMMNTQQREKTLLHSLNLVKPAALIAGEEHLQTLQQIRDELPPTLQQNLYFSADDVKPSIDPDCYTGYIDIETEARECPTNNLDCTKAITLEEPCFYIFTSGTTGLPKASVMSNHRWFKSLAGLGYGSLCLRPNDIFYVCLPLYHNNALTISLAATFGAGAAIALGRKFSASRFWDEVIHYRATGFAYIGELCRYLLLQPEKATDKQHNIKKIIGNGLRPDIWDEFQQRFNIASINEFYGASECNLVFTNTFNMKKTAGFCPLAYEIVAYDMENEELIRDQQGFLQPVKKGKVGLLITKITDRAPFDGYTTASDTEKKLLRNVLVNGDCYFNTGDLVLNQGFRHVAFVDRLGDTYRWKGENVATTEVESVIASFPGVEHAAVYGVQIPHTDGRAGMAAITVLDTSKFKLENLADHLDKSLPSYAKPVFIRIQMQQAVTATFKYQKVALKHEGFDPETITDPIYTLLPGNSKYELLNRETAKAIKENKIRL